MTVKSVLTQIFDVIANGIYRGYNTLGDAYDRYVADRLPMWYEDVLDAIDEAFADESYTRRHLNIQLIAIAILLGVIL